MRQYLLMSVVLVGAGCEGLRECRHGGRDCHAPETRTIHKKPCAPARSQAPPVREEVVEQARASMAQEVLLVPRTAYVPFVAQQPTTPVRLTSSMTVLPPTAPTPTVAAPPPEQPPQPVTTPPPPGKEDCTQQMLDLCKKLNQRLDHMERSLHERKPTICPTPAPHCPTPQPLLPQLFRRPLFHRAERDRCEPAIRCEPGIRCEPSIRCETPCEQPVFHHTQSMPLESMPFPGTPVQSTPLPAPIRIVPPETEAIAPPTRTTNAEAGATDMTPVAPPAMPPAPLPLPAEPTLPLAPPMVPPMAPVQ